MNSQNILKFYGSNLEVKLDTSEFYDYELSNNNLDYDASLLDFTSGQTLSYDSLIVDSTCFNQFSTPIHFEINKPFIYDDCDFTIRKRTEKGWTLNFIFNKDEHEWYDGNIFYYWGISGETSTNNLIDNNLSFSFTNEGRIKWTALRYSGYCDNVSGYTVNNYISSGETDILDCGITLNDFLITVTFNRYYKYENCDLLNEGGSNDLITGWTINNPYNVISGETEDKTIIETVNRNWDEERNKRLGTLTIYLNGKRIYNIENWEEIIPSERDSTNKIVQIFGGGTQYSNNPYSQSTLFNLKRFIYIEQPLNFLQIKHLFITNVNPFYDIVDLSTITQNDFIEMFGVLTEDNQYLLSEDNDSILYKNDLCFNTYGILANEEFYLETVEGEVLLFNKEDESIFINGLITENKESILTAEGFVILYNNLTESITICENDLIAFNDTSLFNENYDNLLTEDNNILIY